MADREYELRLVGLDSPDGEIPFAQLGALASSIQDLVRRIGRQLDARSGPGRTPSALSKATEVRLIGLREGSTRLEFAVGDPSTLELGEDTQQLSERFDELVSGIATNDVPRWADRLVVDAAQQVARSFAASGAEQAFLSHRGSATVPIVVVPMAIIPDVWKSVEAPEPEPVPERRTIVGRLEAVDLSTTSFRIRDDVGHAVRLDHVADADEVGPLVGSRVVAKGVVIPGRRGAQDRLDEATVQLHQPLNALDETARGEALVPPTADDIGITDDDFDAFLEALER